MSDLLQQKSNENVRRTLCGVIDNANNEKTLSLDDVIVVSLCDITLWDRIPMDFPSISQQNVIADVQFDNCDGFPILFTLYYNADEIDINLYYGIRCAIFNKDKQIKYSSERFVDVLTGQHPKTNVQITVVPSVVSPSNRTDN